MTSRTSSQSAEMSRVNCGQYPRTIGVGDNRTEVGVQHLCLELNCELHINGLICTEISRNATAL